MEVLFTFLNWTSSFSHIDEESGSKMDIHNLATVMTPNILYPNTKNGTVDESFLAIEAVNALITYNDTMCEVSSHSPKVPIEIFDLTFFCARFPRTCKSFSVILLCSRRTPK
jgi:hypothetical protein